MFTHENLKRIVEVRAAIKATMDSLTESEGIAAAEHNTASGGGQHLVAVPAAFWNDHTSRDLDSVSVEVRSSSAEWGSYDDGSYVVLVMSDDSLAELVSDSAHYCGGYDQEDYEPLMESARRTIVALWEQEPSFMMGQSDLRPFYDNLRWSLGIKRNDVAIVAGAR
jgi:hypothetical protein